MKRNTSNYPIVACLLLCIAFLAGCGSSPAKENSSATPSPSSSPQASASPSTAAGSSLTRTVTDQYGDKEIPADPERVFSVSATTPLLALGVTPVGGLNYEIVPDHYLSGYQDKIAIAGDYPPNYEAVVGLKPDLIIASSFIDAEVYEQLSKIAPTVVYPWEYNIYDQLRFIAGILDKTAEAEAWIGKHEEKAAAYKEQIMDYVEPDRTVAAIQIFQNSFQVAGNRNMGFVLHDLLGLKRLPVMEQAIENNGGYLVYTDSLTLEMLPEYDADYLVVKVDVTQPGSEQFFETMQQSPIWNNLTAVKNGNVFIVPHDKWWSFTLFSADALLDEALALFKP